MPKRNLQHSSLGIALERLQATSRRPHVESQQEVAIQQHLQLREANPNATEKLVLEARHTHQPQVRRSNVHTPGPPARVDGRAPPQRLRPPNGRAPCLLNVIPPSIQASAITAGRRSKTLGIDLKRITDYPHRPHVGSQQVSGTAIQTSSETS